MPIAPCFDPTTGASGGATPVTPELNPPSTPQPQVLAAGSTALGVTLVGSWSAPVSVAASVQTSNGSPAPTVSISGSGAGPYSISIASGLTNGVGYAITLVGTDTFGQTADVVLSVGVATPAELNPPATPQPQVLAAGSTSLGSTLIGSWSASVSVAASVQTSNGSAAPTVSISGSGAGPYSISIASGLANGVGYAITLTGTDAFGQTAEVVLSVGVAVPAGAADLRELGNLNGGAYTFADTFGLLNNYSYNAGTKVHSFTMNSVAVANEAASFISGTTFTASRWYIPMTYADGSPVLVGDAFAYSVMFEDITSPVARNFVFSLAMSQSGASTSLNTMNAMGGHCGVSSAGGTIIGGWMLNAGNANTVSGTYLRGLVSGNFAGGPTFLNGGLSWSATNTTSSGASGTRSAFTQWNVPATNQLALVFMCGTNGTNTATGGTFSMKVKFALTKFN
jgi:hypothetical protein